MTYGFDTVFNRKRRAALSLTRPTLNGMSIGALQAVAQTLGVAPRQPRAILIEALIRQIERFTRP